MNTFFIIGFMGCGKSYQGKKWAQAYGLPFYETDELVEAAEGKTIAAIFETEGEMYFREKERAVLQTLVEKGNCIVSTGGGTPCFFDNMQLMNDTGTTIYLKASPQLLAQRLMKEKAKRPVIRNIDDASLEIFIAVKLEERTPYYEQAAVVLDAAEIAPVLPEHLFEK
jgi:shikimate kinase